MRVLFTSLRNTSHFLPLIPFIEACKQRGHEVAVAAPSDLGERAAAAGAEFFPFGHPGDAGLGPIWARMRSVSEEEAKSIVIGEIFAGVLAGTALPGLLETVERWKPSIVVRESQEYAAIVATEKFAIPRARVAITAPNGERTILGLAAPAVDVHRRALGLALDPTGERIAHETALTLFPASLDPSEGAGSPALRFRAPRKEAKPLPDWWNGSKAPFVYLTLGTVAGTMESTRSLYGTPLDAVRDLPIRVLLTIGKDLPLESLGEVPSNVHVERFVPQDDVLAHATAVLCHGGSGTVLGTLAAGVPMLVAPIFADQPYNAEHVAAIGAGLSVPMKGATPEDLRRALVRILEEPSFKSAAQRVAAEMAALPPVSDAGAELEKLARSA